MCTTGDNKISRPWILRTILDGIIKGLITATFVYIGLNLINFDVPIKQFYKQDHLKRKKDIIDKFIIFNMSGGFINSEVLSQAMFTFDDNNIKRGIIRLTSSKWQKSQKEKVNLMLDVYLRMIAETYPEKDVRNLKQIWKEEADNPDKPLMLRNEVYSIIPPAEYRLKILRLMEEEDKRSKEIQNFWKDHEPIKKLMMPNNWSGRTKTNP